MPYKTLLFSVLGGGLLVAGLLGGIGATALAAPLPPPLTNAVAGWDLLPTPGRIAPTALASPAAAPGRLLAPPDASADYPAAVAGVGDVNGDGYADLLISTPAEPGVALYLGGPTGPESTPAFTVTGVAVKAVAGAGDVNGDGYADLLIGAVDQTALYLGAAAGISATPAFTTGGASAVAGAGDVNGDGYADFLLGTVDQTALYLGAAAGISTTPAFTAAGSAVAGVGDVNGDGYAELAVGAPDANRVSLYRGSAQGVEATPAVTVTGAPGEMLGMAMTGAGDVNGDGYADLLLEIRYGAGTLLYARAQLYLGTAAGLDLTPVALPVVLVKEGGYFIGNMKMAGVEDVNGDGYADALLSDSTSNQVTLHLGGPEGLAAIPALILEGEQGSGAGDVNGDGCADLLAGDGHRTALYLWAQVDLALSPAWTGPGAVVAGAGDVNGDGYADGLVGAPGASRAYLYPGGPAGLSPTPLFTATGAAGDQLGAALAGAGDVNGDGYADGLVGAPGASRVYLYPGGPAGLSPTPLFTATGAAGEALGAAVAGVGDVNGDGYADLLVGAPGASRAYLYLGCALGVQAPPALTITGAAGNELGAAVAGAGDVNGDGYADLLVGAPGGSRAYLYLGNAAGVQSTPAFTAVGAAGDALGAAVAGAGDVDGDGYADVAVGAPAALSGRGRVYLHLGNGSGVGATAHLTLTGAVGEQLGAALAGVGDANADGRGDLLLGAPGAGGTGAVYLLSRVGSAPHLTRGVLVTATLPGAQSGAAVAGAGDVNGDGYADLLFGAPGVGDGGQATLLWGQPAGVSPRPLFSVSGPRRGSMLGYTVASAGDVNGDGYADVFTSIWMDGAYLYLGTPDGLQATPALTLSSAVGGDHLGYALAGVGDVNGDGYGDALVGAFGTPGGSYQGAAYLYLGGPAGLPATPALTVTGVTTDLLGYAAAGAGDVNGDGYADVLIGAPYAPHGSLYGQVYGYLGSATGLRAAPAFTLTGVLTDDCFGSAMAGAGDVNGDGYADVLVGAVYAPAGSKRGQVYLYLGGPAGLAPTPAFTATGAADGDHLGWSVAGAGDVNGDGYADVAWGAYGVDGNRGQVALHLGGPAGISAVPVFTVTGLFPDDTLGWSVAGAGDVNGDGYADVLVGVPGAWGQALLYLGSAAGLMPTPVFTATGAAWQVSLGWSVAGAGDVNGDGYADLLIGALWAPGGTHGVALGQVYLYAGNGGHGRPAGVWQRGGTGATQRLFPWSTLGSTDTLRVALRAVAPAGRSRVKAQVEACPPGVPFTAAACVTGTAPTWTDVTTAATGITVTVEVTGLRAATLYRWRARLLYAPWSSTATGQLAAPAPGPWRRPTAQTVEADGRTVPRRCYLPVVLRRR